MIVVTGDLVVNDHIHPLVFGKKLEHENAPLLEPVENQWVQPLKQLYQFPLLYLFTVLYDLPQLAIHTVRAVPH